MAIDRIDSVSNIFDNNFIEQEHNKKTQFIDFKLIVKYIQKIKKLANQNFIKMDTLILEVDFI